ncbi:MFS transporter [Streptomyces canus]|uniref:MFS transporter n=1 Tax=Streptomyces canus TaxID=58343 RepID=UPI00371D5107
MESRNESTTAIPELHPQGLPAPKRVELREVKYATVVAFLAWTFAVYDFILFGTLLPKIGAETGLDNADQAGLATAVALGTVVVALAVGPVVDKFGRRAGMVFTVGGASLASALTALAGMLGAGALVAIRSVAGLGYAEQGVNGAYLSELYDASDDPRVAKRRGLVYSLVQGGWPVGALLAAGLTALLLPVVGWRGCFLFAALPSLIIALAATKLRESPQFERIKQARKLKEQGLRPEAASMGEGEEKAAGLRAVFQGDSLRTTLALGIGHLMNWFPVQVFSVLGTTVLVNVHHVTFSNSLIILLLSNLVAYAGYLVHGFFGDRFHRRNVVSVGWLLGGVVMTAMLFGPDQPAVVITLYSVGMFFLIGPYSCLLFLAGESYDSSVRGTGASLVTAIGPIGAVLASAASTALLGNGGHWQMAAFFFGAVPCFISGLVVLASRKRPQGSLVPESVGAVT